MAAEIVTFDNVDRRTFDALQDRLMSELEGTRPDSIPGSIDVLGVMGTLTYDESASTLSVSIRRVPRIISRGYALGWVHDALVAAANA
jgi:hypothetical protein